MSAYSDSNQYLSPVQTLEKWNYEIPITYRETKLSLSKNAVSEEKIVPETYYKFSGTYGSNLIEEVQRYAEVGERIAEQYCFDVIHAMIG